MFQKRFKAFMPSLVARLHELYGTRWDYYLVLQQLTVLMEKNASERSNQLRMRDTEDTAHGDWFLDENQTGIVLYVDLFAKNISGLQKKIPYLQNLGITYVHLMPLFKSPDMENDGGYAVSSYRDVDSKLGTIKQLSELAKQFHDAGIVLVLDFVFNHTSDEHTWAEQAKKGDEKFKKFYFIYSEKAEADEWNQNLREIFPDTRRGSFTFVEKAGGWVWTTFNSFQWDLDYSNPDVFLAMCEEMLFLANLGVDVLRLDALAFVWKEKGTSCENLPKAHTLIQAFQFVARIVCPSLVFKSEAIVHPDEVIKYIGKDECRLSYNPLQMALFWDAIATRNTRLLSFSLAKRWEIPHGSGWVNYIRCHDDIGWTFSDEDAQHCGINAYDHRRFLNDFYTGKFPGSFARGVPFQLNPETGDCRVSGTTASLTGLEDAFNLHKEGLSSKDPTSLALAELYGDMAIKRMLMLYALLFALPGIPLLYAGDEFAMLNDYSYTEDPTKKDDSRWVHRIADPSVSQKITTDMWLKKRQDNFTASLQKIISLRKNELLFGHTGIRFFDSGLNEILCFDRFGTPETIGFYGCVRVIANMSDRTVSYTSCSVFNGIELLTGEPFTNAEIIVLEPYKVMWLKEE